MQPVSREQSRLSRFGQQPSEHTNCPKAWDFAQRQIEVRALPGLRIETRGTQLLVVELNPFETWATRPPARCHPERLERSARSRRTCFSGSEAAERTSRMGICFSRPSLTRRNGCPILATLLSLWPGWDCTNPTHTQPSLAKRFSAESNGDLLLLPSSRRDLGFIYGRSRGLQAPEKRPQTNPGFSPGVLYQRATAVEPSEGYGL